GLRAIAVDSQSAYVTNEVDGSVIAIPIAQGTPRTITTGLDHPAAIVAAPSGLYWLNRGSTGGTPGSVMALLSSGSMITIASNQSFPAALTVDDSHVYWVNGRDGSIWKSDLSGGAVTQLRAPGGEFGAVDIGLHSGRLYLTGLSFGLAWMSTDGGPLTYNSAASTTGGYAHMVIASNAMVLLWKALPLGSAADVISVFSPDALQITPLAGNLPTTLAIAADETSVYWTEFGDAANGALIKMPR